MPMNERGYALSFRTVRKGYQGLYSVPASAHWIFAPGIHNTPEAAEAAAGHALVAFLNANLRD